MRRVDGKAVSVGLRRKAVYAAVVIPLGKYSHGVGYRIAAQQARIVCAERVVPLSPLAELLNERGRVIAVAVIAHFAESHEIGLQARYLIGYSLSAAGHHGTLLPDVPLQYGESPRLRYRTAQCCRHCRGTKHFSYHISLSFKLRASNLRIKSLFFSIFDLRLRYSRSAKFK